MNREDMTQFNVTIYLNDGNGKATTLKGTIEFIYDPNEPYGNGYTMVITGLGEPWKEQGYDIRYDTTFLNSNPILYIVQFYTERFTGENGSWLLTGIRVHEAEF